jgi:hypothetical protein
MTDVEFVVYEYGEDDDVVIAGTYPTFKEAVKQMERCHRMTPGQKHEVEKQTRYVQRENKYEVVAMKEAS